MKTVVKKKFAEIDSYEFGYSLVGHPWMTVHLFIADGLLIDTAQAHLRPEVLEILRQHDFDRVLLTHHHEDHSGNAEAIRQQLGTPVFAHPLTVEKLSKGYRILPYQKIVWGRSIKCRFDPLPVVIEGNSLRFTPIHTPGHSRDHCVFLVKEKGWLFSGDLYIGDRIRYFRVDERIDQQIDSIKKVLVHDFEILLCSHRPQLSEGKKRLQLKLQFLENFAGEVGRYLDEGLSDREIPAKLGLKEVRSVQLFTCGNVSLSHMIGSVRRARDEKMKQV
jgi:glyoxylase-like metal-dependent hydrolase (beta-lactamase superfamily II)